MKKHRRKKIVKKPLKKLSENAKRFKKKNDLKFINLVKTQKKGVDNILYNMILRYGKYVGVLMCDLLIYMNLI